MSKEKSPAVLVCMSCGLEYYMNHPVFKKDPLEYCFDCGDDFFLPRVKTPAVVFPSNYDLKKMKDYEDTLMKNMKFNTVRLNYLLYENKNKRNNQYKDLIFF